MGFPFLGLHQLYCNITADNKASIKLFTNAGFNIISRKKDWIWTGEKWEDELSMAFGRALREMQLGKLRREALKDMADTHNCCLIVTTGGTGPDPKDLTPEATEAVCERMMPGFGELMRQVSLQYVPTAILSRQTAGIRGNSLIINLPGKPKSIRECLDAVFPAVPYCVDLIEGPFIETNEEVIKAFRPKSK